MKKHLFTTPATALALAAGAAQAELTRQGIDELKSCAAGWGYTYTGGTTRAGTEYFVFTNTTGVIGFVPVNSSTASEAIDELATSIGDYKKDAPSSIKTETATPEMAPATNKEDSKSGGGLLLMLLTAYFFPAITAGLRRHHNGGAIFATNLLLGWTMLGWAVALIWALTNPAPARK